MSLQKNFDRHNNIRSIPFKEKYFDLLHKQDFFLVIAFDEKSIYFRITQI